VDFRNCVIIMTSNLGSDELQRLTGIGASDAKLRESAMDALRGQFRPEFLNRVDEVVVFHSLQKKDMGQIVEIQLGRLRALLRERQLGLTLTDAARDFIVEQGYDPVYGARPLKRAIQNLLQNPLAMAVLQGQFKAGDTVLVDVAGDRLSFAATTGGTRPTQRAARA
jgi:ATP-dependent Clp protease ATP-binding subunit ClpB